MEEDLLGLIVPEDSSSTSVTTETDGSDPTYTSRFDVIDFYSS